MIISDEQEKHARQLADAWTKGTKREDCFNETAMGWYLLDALDELRQARQENARLVESDKLFRGLYANEGHKSLVLQETLSTAQRELDAARKVVEAILFQVIQGKVLERDDCITQARAWLSALAASPAAGEVQPVEVGRGEVERLREALDISPDDCGRIMHESWMRTKLAQGFHRTPPRPELERNCPCPKCHADLIPWDELPEKQKDINRHAFDDVLAEIRRRAALTPTPAAGGAA